MMAIIGSSPFAGSSLSLSAESASIIKRFRNDTGDSQPITSYSIGVGCNEDSDCPMGNLCIESSCYYKCNHGNDCPFWHTCRDDLHDSHSVCGPYAQNRASATLPSSQINPNKANNSNTPQDEDKGFFSTIYRFFTSLM